MNSSLCMTRLQDLIDAATSSYGAPVDLSTYLAFNRSLEPGIRDVNVLAYALDPQQLAHSIQGSLEFCDGAYLFTPLHTHLIGFGDARASKCGSARRSVA